MNFWNLKAPFYIYCRTVWPFSTILRRETFLAAQVLSTMSELQGYGLDLGSGPGHSFNLLPVTLKRVGMDRSQSMARRCRATHGNLMVVADARSIPFKAESFAMVAAVGLTEYIKDVNKLFAELGAITRSHGSILLTISPAGLYTYARYLTGHRLWIHKTEHLPSIAKQNGFLLAAVSHSFSQHIFLLQKRRRTS